jgi:DNA-binding transcriptional ArsR family regulator
MRLTDSLTTTFSALADPTRRAILSRLVAGETSVSELAKPFAISAPAVTKHLRVLEKAGLIERSRRAQWRPCRLNATPLKDAARWIEPFGRLWNDRLDGLADYLHEIQTKERNDER